MQIVPNRHICSYLICDIRILSLNFNPGNGLFCKNRDTIECNLFSWNPLRTIARIKTLISCAAAATEEERYKIGTVCDTTIL